MLLKKDETYICAEPTCEAEVLVTKSAKNACAGEYVVRCCCGKEMTREDGLQFIASRGEAKAAKS